MKIIEREYEYKPGWFIILIGGGMFGLAVVFFAREALNNDRGLIINHIIELSENGATIFYWVFCFLSFCFVAATLAMIYHRWRFRQRVALTADGIILPAGRFSAGEKFIEYKNISGLSETSINGQDFLNILHANGKDVITRSMLPSKQVYREIIELLQGKMSGQ